MSKNPDAFKTISEVADELELPQHVLRFWETRFNQIKPMKRGGGRRYYRPDDVDLLRGIKSLLYDEGYTIRGVQRLLKEQGNRLAVDFGKGQAPAGIINTEPQMMGLQEEEGESPAVSISDIGGSKSKKSKGLLGRLTGKSEDDDQQSGAAIAGTDLKTLQSTLRELLECKRLLDQTRQG
ncbi:MAG: MerR family transcriptional regulator [Rhizobiaceae bacterium]|nr:MerR family transcriptional regulator [Rhizobiaceae bacterium]